MVAKKELTSSEVLQGRSDLVQRAMRERYMEERGSRPGG